MNVTTNLFIKVKLLLVCVLTMWINFRLFIKTKKSCRKGKQKRADRSGRTGDLIGEGFYSTSFLFIIYLLATYLSKKYVRHDA